MTDVEQLAAWVTHTRFTDLTEEACQALKMRLLDAPGLEKIMFEAADPEVFAWYIKRYGAEVNFFVDHSQIVQVECLRSDLWGAKSLWGRILTYKDGGEHVESRKEHL
jgi:phosphosulfolactate synthase (CoM biosynthesis protein A)